MKMVSFQRCIYNKLEERPAIMFLIELIPMNQGYIVGFTILHQMFKYLCFPNQIVQNVSGKMKYKSQSNKQGIAIPENVSISID